MTPDELARLTRVEVESRATRADVKDMKEKLDRLCQIAAMGQGAWYAILRLGAVLAVLAAAGWAVFTFAVRR